MAAETLGPHWRPFVAAVVIASCLLTASRDFVALPTRARWSGTASPVARQAELSVRAPSEWRLGVGKAIDVLRTDIVGLFEHEGHVLDYSIYGEDIAFVDARLPSFKLNGLDTYKQVLSTLQWSAWTACEERTFEITALSPPVNNEIYMRWRLRLWPKDVLASASGIFPFSTPGSLARASLGIPFIVEGYSRYQFDPWSAKIVRHSIDITNPPTYINDLIAQFTTGFTWQNPVALAGIPSMRMAAAASPDAPSAAPFAGNSLQGKERTGTGSIRKDQERVGRPSMRDGFAFLPQACEDDFECNDGAANFPMRCCEMPLLGKWCCEPDDFMPVPQSPAWVPIPVPVDDDAWKRP